MGRGIYSLAAVLTIVFFPLVATDAQRLRRYCTAVTSTSSHCPE
jgi:hypothetical protein